MVLAERIQQFFLIYLQQNRSKNMTRQKCEVFSRSMGYIRPISNFNIGKRAEFEERKTFVECNCLKDRVCVSSAQ